MEQNHQSLKVNPKTDTAIGAHREAGADLAGFVSLSLARPLSLVPMYTLDPYMVEHRKAPQWIRSSSMMRQASLNSHRTSDPPGYCTLYLPWGPQLCTLGGWKWSRTARPGGRFIGIPFINFRRGERHESFGDGLPLWSILPPSGHLFEALSCDGKALATRV